MAVRMKDIAEALNVSVVTVSKVLNNNAKISEETRQRVLACAKQLGYRTNLAAKGLVTGQSRMLGLIVPDLLHGFFSEIAAGISDAIRQQGYGLIIASSREDPQLEHQEIDQMLARSVDALLVATCESQPGVFDAIAAEVPLILVDRQIAHEFEENYVGTDDLVAGELAAQHLVDIGRKRIAHIAGPRFSPGIDRERGYHAVLARNGIEVPASYVVRRNQNDESSYVTGAQAMKKLLKLTPLPDAVFCYNDPTAVGAMSEILDAGLQIPKDIAIIGCGNSRHGAYLRVSLTSIDQNTTLLGQEAAHLALSAIQSRRRKTPKSQSIVIKPTLIIRNSTLTPAKPVNPRD